MAEFNEFEVLETFLIDNPELDRLEGLLSEFNLFETLNITQVEVRHSNVLAWLMDPRSNHGIGSYFLQQFLKIFVSENKSALSDVFTVFDAELLNFSDVEILREWGNIDIVLMIRDGSNKIALVIENKIKSVEHSNQLQRYREIVEKEFSDYKRIYMYLAPDNLPPSDDNWLCFNYSSIAKTIDDLLLYRRDSLNEMVAEFISQYNTNLRRYIVGNSEVEHICQEIYKKHKSALDLIFQYKPDTELEISEYLQQKIKLVPSLILDTAGKTVIRFTPEYLDNLIDKVSEGWSKSKRIIMFEFSNYDVRLHLNLYLGPGPDEYRNKLFDFFCREPGLFKLAQRKFGTKWHCVYQKKFLSKKDKEDATISDISAIIDKKWDDFIGGDLQKIIDHFRTHWKSE